METLARKIEIAHLTYANEKGNGFRILFENDNVAFTADEEVLFKKLWKQGIHVTDIAREMNRTEKEVVGLVVELAYEGKIKPRPGALAGKEWECKK